MHSPSTALAAQCARSHACAVESPQPNAVPADLFAYNATLITAQNVPPVLGWNQPTGTHAWSVVVDCCHHAVVHSDYCTGDYESTSDGSPVGDCIHTAEEVIVRRRYHPQCLPASRQQLCTMWSHALTASSHRFQVPYPWSGFSRPCMTLQFYMHRMHMHGLRTEIDPLFQSHEQHRIAMQHLTSNKTRMSLQSSCGVSILARS